MKPKNVQMKARSSSGAWTDVTFPAWLKLADLRKARKEFQGYQDDKKGALGYVPRSHAQTWLEKNRPEWVKDAGFYSLMLSYALCLENRAVRFSEVKW